MRTLPVTLGEHAQTMSLHVFAMMASSSGTPHLSPDEVEKAKEAITVLSSILGPDQSSKSRPRSITVATPSVSQAQESQSEVLKAADRALKALRGMRSGLAGDDGWKKKRLKSELKNSFASTSKRPKKPAWKHRFICLAWRGKHKIPTTDVEKDSLLEAGLGEKLVEFPSLDISAEEFKEILCMEFPKLQGCGGFELCRCIPNSRNLEALTSIAISSPALLKERVGNARTYICPLQVDLELDAVFGLPEGPKEECLTCGVKLSLQDLKEHIDQCRRRPSSPDPPLSPTPPSSPKMPAAFPGSVDVAPGTGKSSTDVILVESEDDTFTLEGNNLSADDIVYSQSRSIQDVVKEAQTLVTEPKFTFLVRRASVLKDALLRMDKVNFSPLSKVTVNFLGEQGTDTGGMTRELFTLLSKDIMSMYMGGGTGTFKHNSVALQENIYMKLGQLAAMAIAHGGAGFHILSSSVYNYISGMSVADMVVCIDEVPQDSVKMFLKKVMCTTTKEEVQNLAMDNIELLVACGYVKPAARISWEDQAELVQSVTLHHVILECKAEIDQFMEGLKQFNIIDTIKEHPNILKPFLCVRIDNATAEDITTLFKINLSEKGSSSHITEEEAYMNFVTYLEECERAEKNNSTEEKGVVTLCSVIGFFSGGEEIPPMGFVYEPQLFFNGDNIYPTASTCAVQLTLPTKYSNYKSFKTAMTTGFMFHGGFGLE